MPASAGPHLQWGCVRGTEEVIRTVICTCLFLVLSNEDTGVRSYYKLQVPRTHFFFFLVLSFRAELFMIVHHEMLYKFVDLKTVRRGFVFW